MNAMRQFDRDAKLRLFRECFTGRQDVYGTYDPATHRSWQVKAPVTERVLLDHLVGRKPYGVYLLVGDRTRAIVADFDKDDLAAPMDFVAVAAHYGLAAYVERSKRKGYHIWSFFGTDGVSARKARLVFRHMLDEAGAGTIEVFPKQDALAPDSSQYGNFVNAPLFGRLVSKGRTVFLNTSGPVTPYPDQWSSLADIRRATESQLDEIIEINELERSLVPGPGVKGGTLGVFRASEGLPPCARKMLGEGVTENQRSSCFRLAVHLRKKGLPFDITVAALAEWARKNRPADGRRIITLTEVKAQTSSAYLKEYRGCGCEDPAVAPYCDPSCAVRSSGNEV